MMQIHADPDPEQWTWHTKTVKKIKRTSPPFHTLAFL
jgi:hypothetical protein